MSYGEDAKHRQQEELSLIRKNGVCNNSAGCEGGEHLRDTEKLNVLDVCGAKITWHLFAIAGIVSILWP